jgi:16S rRNA C967 or C1407 C5-methylase (RsmB/RsmF family)/NOL1/NOP2/fmu family ribosome biogenesis protein
MFPKLFETQMQGLLGTEMPAFLEALQQAPPVSVRWNPLVPTRVRQAAPWAHSTPVPWHSDGVYLPQRPVFTTDPLFQAGAYYVQEAASMFVFEALRQILPASKPLRALDLCAAPGGKSTLLVSALPEGSLLVANEVIKTRVPVLRENLEKWGYDNTAVTSAEATVFAENLPGFFDLVLVDAPCSGEGMFRKDPDAVREWSPAHVEFCAGRQKSILAEAVQTLAPGGWLLYSTCTYNRQENEQNCAWLCREMDLEYVPLETPADWGITSAERGYQFYPHHTRGEGFFIAVFQKKEGIRPKINAPGQFRSLKPLSKNDAATLRPWLQPEQDMRFFQLPGGEILSWPAWLESDFLILDKALKNKWFGVMLGEVKGKDLIPAQALAHSRLRAESVAALELPAREALLFLQKENFEIHTPLRGWALATFQGLGLGWMKVLPNRINNYFPMERRVRMVNG